MQINDYEYISSSIGNAFFSGVTFGELWKCVSSSTNREELDEAVSKVINDKEKSKDKILEEILNLIREGYDFELHNTVVPDYENDLEITELYLSVENPNYRPDDGSDQNIVIKL